MICRFQRPPGALPSSMLGLEALTGDLDDFGVEDYLNGNDYLAFFTFVFVSFLTSPLIMYGHNSQIHVWRIIISKCFKIDIVVFASTVLNMQ